MELMEDGNLMDKVHILIQRDLEYYKVNQKVLQESICSSVSGGHLDFPRNASFAAVKLVFWWEEEYLAAFRRSSNLLQPSNPFEADDPTTPFNGCGGIVKASDPSKFVTLITKSSEQLLEHLHVLTQEALDHADLSVLTGTIGAVCLLGNCLGCYVRYWPEAKSELVDRLQVCERRFREMAEALAERLLDLHCRLLSLYILQDGESLDWENEKAFCEDERGSYVVQMWWLYMKGTKEDLWNTVPPKMAQRVFAGLLNDSLTILTVRYTQARPSKSRSRLHVVDVSNILLCLGQLLPNICENSNELLGYSLKSCSKILRDIHIKCQELLLCFLMRGAPLEVIHKILSRDGANFAALLQPSGAQCSWTLLALKDHIKGTLTNLTPEVLITLELQILFSQPQPNWSLLLKTLVMRNYKLLRLIFDACVDSEDIQTDDSREKNCKGFLCPVDGSCLTEDAEASRRGYLLASAATHVFLVIGSREELSEFFLSIVCKRDGWSSCLDRKHVWNQKRPAWYEPLIETLRPFLPPIATTVVKAVQTGASMYQAMSIILGCFSQLWDCMGAEGVATAASVLQDIVPFDVQPLGGSTLLQVLIAALYSELLDRSSDADVALAVAEALCSIDEDNKHTEQIELFLEEVRLGSGEGFGYNCEMLEESDAILDIVASDLLMTNYGKRSLKNLYNFMRNNQEWIFTNISSPNPSQNLPENNTTTPDLLLHTMFHIGNQQFDQMLTNDWKPHWSKLLQIPLGFSSEKVYNQLASRWEFHESNPLNINITKILKEI